MIRYRRSEDRIIIQWTSPDATLCKYRIDWGTYDDLGQKVPNTPQGSNQYRDVQTEVFNGLSPYTRYWFEGTYIESVNETEFDSFAIDITTLSGLTVNVAAEIYENAVELKVTTDTPVDFGAVLDGARVVAREKQKQTDRTVIIDQLEPMKEYNLLIVLRGDEALFERNYTFTTRQSTDQAFESDDLALHVLEAVETLDMNPSFAVRKFINGFRGALRQADLSQYEAAASPLTNDQINNILDNFTERAIDYANDLRRFIQELFNWLKYQNTQNGASPLTTAQKIAIFKLFKESADNVRLNYETATISRSIESLNKVGLVGASNSLRTAYDAINPTPLSAPSGIDFGGYTEPKISTGPMDYTVGDFAEELVRDYTQANIRLRAIPTPSGAPIVPDGGSPPVEPNGGRR